MANHSKSLNNGTIIDSTYRVLDFLGEGGMGIVYKVEHAQMNRTFALKILKTSQLSESTWQRFRNEAQAIARLDHRNVVKIYDMNQTENGRPFYTMDFLVGVSLSDYLKEHKVVTLGQALHIFRQVCSGLAYAHSRGIVHRDIKPGNIMLLTDPKTQQFQVKIVDFGIAKLIDDEGHTIQGLTKPGEVFGSPLYMSPEQCEGRRLDARSDMYSVGVALFKALTGKTPFRGRNAIETTMMHQSAVPPLLNSVSAELQFPPKLEKIIDKMLAKSPDQRFQSLAEVENELQNLQIKIDQAPRAVALGEAEAEEVPDDQLEQTETVTSSGTVSGTQTVEHKRLNLRLTLMVVIAFAAIGLAITMLFAMTRNLAAKKAPNLAMQNSPLAIASAKNPKTTTKPEVMKDALAAAPEMENYDNELTGSVGQSTSKDLIDLEQDEKVDVQKFLKAKFEPFAKARQLPDGKSGIAFQFPQKFSIGTVIFSPKKAEIQNKKSADRDIIKAPAQGLQQVPIGAAVRFEANELVGDFPQLLSYFQAIDLFDLRLAKGTSRSAELFKNIALLTSLQGLELASCELADSDLPILETLVNLRTLNISRCQISGEALAKSPLISHIHVLDVEGMKNVSPLIESLGPNTEQLWLNYCLLTAADLRKLASLPNLTVLHLKGCEITDSDFSNLAGMKQLMVLNLKDCNKLTPASAETIKSLKKLKTLSLSPQLNTDEIYAKLKANLPGLILL